MHMTNFLGPQHEFLYCVVVVPAERGFDKAGVVIENASKIA